MCHTKDAKMVPALALSYDRQQKVKSRGNALAQKQAQLIPCTVVLYDKGGTIQ